MPRGEAKGGPAADETGVIFEVQKFSLHDGAGFRTLVFLKGCPLNCAWCSNPEGQSHSPDVFFTPDRCIGTADCGKCIPACTARAIRAGAGGLVGIDRAACDACGACVPACPAKALELSGERVTVSDVIRRAEEDAAFYVRSSGGLTLGGGEPLCQAEFAARLLAAAQGRGLDTVIETCGFCPWKSLEMVAPRTDQIFFDIKCINPDNHRVATGVSNEIILDNFRKLRAQFPNIAVVVRTPVIPGVNDTEQEIRAIAEFIAEAGGASEYELLPYHSLGGPKYARLGRPYGMGDIDAPSEQHMALLKQVAASVPV